jgi:hypothetical protein
MNVRTCVCGQGPTRSALPLRILIVQLDRLPEPTFPPPVYPGPCRTLAIRALFGLCITLNNWDERLYYLRELTKTMDRPLERSPISSIPAFRSCDHNICHRCWTSRIGHAQDILIYFLINHFGILIGPQPYLSPRLQRYHARLLNLRLVKLSMDTCTLQDRCHHARICITNMHISNSPSPPFRREFTHR